MKPWQLVLAHMYAEALDAYDHMLLKGGDEEGAVSGPRATALLCLGRYEEALNGFVSANQAQEKGPLAGYSPYIDQISVCQWLSGKKQEAIATLANTMKAVERGAIAYADNAGGASHGLLCWYFAVTYKDGPNKNLAERYLAALSKKSRIKHWPGPLAMMILGREKEDAILEGIGVSNVVAPLGEQSKGDLLFRRKYCKYLFYVATLSRASGSEEQCIVSMRACSQIENPIIEPEWYLANFEAGIHGN